MKKLRITILFLTFLLLTRTTIAQEAPPNIIVILVDDLGFSDLGCYGGEIPTPNIDRLAAQGLRFTNFYNAARCCPSRAALLTGVYPHQAGIGHMMNDRGAEHPGYRGHLNDQTVTIADVLGQAGYFTAMTGKWHVGHAHGIIPTTRGFDRSLYAPAGGFYYGDGKNAKLFLNGQPIENDSPLLPKNWYSTDLWTTAGLQFIDEALQEDKPFLLYLAHNAPHFPLQAPSEEIEKFKGKYLAGWEKLREERYKRQLELGVIDSSWKLPPFNPKVPKWNSLTTEEKERYDHIMAIFAAVVSRLDKSIGDLVEGLKKRHVLENTIIVFFSDNGGNPEPGAEARYEGEYPGSSQSSVFLGQGWAELGCTPFWAYKHHTHEGGISSPTIVHWPKGIPTARRGLFERQSAHITDILATVADLGQATYPQSYRDNQVIPAVGVSLIPAFSGHTIDRVNPIFWEHEGNRAVLSGKWKLVAEWEEDWQLYDIENDRTELHNRIQEYPEVAEQLIAAYKDWSKKVNVEPWTRGVKWFYDYEKAKNESN
ncbi:arylsulfatase [Sphingobacterium corticibacterium]|uniref:Arylsulfatase n=1 Tax=Sphingobacterium corticibacterium TaxID=2484746 RepID=A0A4V2DBK8_9SPHI|nr:arylsulfatase [Sphingobacterium corticibacterium]RZF58338.1 arylsulfatase [Sphingobacterium corticibacterium]